MGLKSILISIIDNIKTFFVFVILHKFNKVPKESLDILETNWYNKPRKGLSLWIYNTIKRLNGL